jgi:hypothetical protein
VRRRGAAGWTEQEKTQQLLREGCCGEEKGWGCARVLAKR